MVLLIDNYDSFVHNLARYVGLLGRARRVARNDAITLQQIKDIAPAHIILSPGPCTPNEAGICLALVAEFAGRIPILGICLGHQVIGQALGGKVVAAPTPMHGKSSQVYHCNEGLFKGLPTPLTVGRYHSLIVDPVPASLRVMAWTAAKEVMAFRHADFPVHGIQFHPESVLTPQGMKLLKAFLES